MYNRIGWFLADTIQQLVLLEEKGRKKYNLMGAEGVYDYLALVCDYYEEKLKDVKLEQFKLALCLISRKITNAVHLTVRSKKTLLIVIFVFDIYHYTQLLCLECTNLLLNL